MKHHINVKMYGPTTQCNSKTYSRMFRLSVTVTASNLHVRP